MLLYSVFQGTHTLTSTKTSIFINNGHVVFVSRTCLNSNKQATGLWASTPQNCQACLINCAVISKKHTGDYTKSNVVDCAISRNCLELINTAETSFSVGSVVGVVGVGTCIVGIIIAGYRLMYQA